MNSGPCCMKFHYASIWNRGENTTFRNLWNILFIFPCSYWQVYGNGVRDAIHFPEIFGVVWRNAHYLFYYSMKSTIVFYSVTITTPPYFFASGMMSTDIRASEYNQDVSIFVGIEFLLRNLTKG